MAKKRILHFITGLETGGAETQLLRILPEIQKYHENRVCCLRRRGSVGKLLERNGVPVHYLDAKSVFDIFVIFRFYKVIKNFTPEILVTYLIHADLFGRIVGRLFGIKKIICSKRGALLQWEWLSFYDRLTKKLVTHYLVQTETAKKEWMNKLKINGSKFTVIPNGIDTNSYQTVINITAKKNELQIKEDLFVISCVGRLRRGKGHEILIEAFERIFKNNDKIILLIVGNGEKEEDLKNITTSHASKNNIYFLGFRTDVSEILAISDLFVMPTEKEGMSNAIIEAMVAGVPVITTNIPENRDIIENQKSGILFPVNDINALEKWIKLLIISPDLRNNLSQYAQQKAKNTYDIRIVTNRFAKFYQEI